MNSKISYVYKVAHFCFISKKPAWACFIMMQLIFTMCNFPGITHKRERERERESEREREREREREGVREIDM